MRPQRDRSCHASVNQLLSLPKWLPGNCSNISSYEHLFPAADSSKQALNW